MRTLIAAFVLIVTTATAQNFIPPPTEIYELNAEELRSIGIVLRSDMAYFVERSSTRNAAFRKILISPQMIQFISIGRHKKEIPSKFIPIFSVTEYSGGSAAYFSSHSHFAAAAANKAEYSAEASRFYTGTNNLLAVRFRLEGGGNAPANVTLWYVPSKEFLDALPARYNLKHGNSATEEIDNTRTEHSEQAVFELKGLAPNPVIGGQTSLKIVAHDKVMLTMALFDISGRKLLDFGTFDFLQGERDIALNLGSLPPGMYIVGVHSAEGTAKFERLMTTN